MSRREELEHGLRTVRERIDAACGDAGRDRDELTLVVVTKFFPASDVDHLLDLGVHAIGESRDQEASAKLTELGVREDLEVHFIGQLQRNKARSVTAYADVVQSVDRVRLVAALGAAARDRLSSAPGSATPLAVLLQVDLDEAAPDRGRGGARPEELADLAGAVSGEPELSLRGVMAVAPPDADPLAAFVRLRTAAERLRERWPEAGWISAGMSGDLEAAIAAGATHLRVGSAILGSRPPLR